MIYEKLIRVRIGHEDSDENKLLPRLLRYLDVFETPTDIERLLRPPITLQISLRLCASFIQAQKSKTRSAVVRAAIATSCGLATERKKSNSRCLWALHISAVSTSRRDVKADKAMLGKSLDDRDPVPQGLQCEDSSKLAFT